MPVASWVVPTFGINANILLLGSFPIGQTFSGIAQSASFKIQLFDFSYMEFINNIALALSVPSFHHTYPVFLHRHEYFI